MTLRIGVIGTGRIGTDHIQRITRKLSGAEITAVTDVDLEQAARVVAEEGINARVHREQMAIINDDNVDALIVASWGPTHEAFVLAAIETGKPVFCEKPLATTAEGCRRIVDAELKLGKKLVQVGFMRRYDHSYRLLKQTLAADTIGEPLVVYCAHRAPMAPGFSGDMAITDSSVHEFDILRWLLNDDFVSAQVVLPRRSRLAEEGLQDPHLILLETGRGTRISIESFVNARYGYDIRCEVVGESGIAALPDPIGTVLRKDARLATPIQTEWKDRFVAAFDTEFQEWINAAQKGEMHGPSAWDGYMVAITSDACVAAKHGGGIVPIQREETPTLYR